MTSFSLSHSSGIPDKPLLDFSIGAASRNAAALGAPQGRDGPFCRRRSVVLAWLALDRRDVAQRPGDGCRIFVGSE